MRFCDKLNLLMQITRISSVALARGTGVDPSLVSRWRSGERNPSKRSHTAEDVGAFLSGAVLLPADRGLLVFLDPRFLDPEFAACFPAQWFRDTPRELVSTAILSDVDAFWAAASE